MTSGYTNGKRATPMPFALRMIEALKRHSCNWQDILQTVQIPPASLTDGQAKITAAQMETLSALTMQRLNDEALGWFERPLPWGSYGMLARASLSAPSLEVALKRWCRHHGLLTQAVSLKLSMDTQHATLTLLTPAVAPEDLEFCSVTLLRNVLGFASWIVDSRIPVQQVSLAYPAPMHAEAYGDLFACPTAFGAAHTSLRIERAYLRLAPCRTEDAARAMLQRALPLTVRHYPQDRLLVQRVRQLLRDTPGLWRHADAVADALSMSTRSLHRQLANQGTHWQEIKTQERQRLAKSWLSQTDRPIQQIASACGFEDAKSFSRAFKSWTQRSPDQFRRSERDQRLQLEV